MQHGQKVDRTAEEAAARRGLRREGRARGPSLLRLGRHLPGAAARPVAPPARPQGGQHRKREAGYRSRRATSAASGKSARAPAYRSSIPSSCSTGRPAARSRRRRLTTDDAPDRSSRLPCGACRRYAGANVHGAERREPAVLDTLFKKLQEATDPVTIQTLERRSGSSGPWCPITQQRALMMRGMGEMQQPAIRRCGRDLHQADRDRARPVRGLEQARDGPLAARRLHGLAQPTSARR